MGTGTPLWWFIRFRPVVQELLSFEFFGGEGGLGFTQT
jgi:hypothetical protein